MVRGMALTVEMVTIDCAEPRALAGFWTEALGYEVASDHDGHYVLLTPPRRLPAAPRMLPTPSRPASAGPGATVVDEQCVPGRAWTVLADPKGTVFCVGAPE